ncbi:hypothetical protein KUCAC02_009852 [Chaenocephalus aceratus]|uniref:Uncharacterized protein n=1 Tax=Chaenocephalus aceratus TaxID=36190 RepID=A0ACB9VXI1_CHAAC|nr:hypothetical protein KUCAC02_009852 [Chaenocephalus aceratus]
MATATMFTGLRSEDHSPGLRGVVLVVERRGECWQDSLVLVEVVVPMAVAMSMFAQDRGPLDPFNPVLPEIQIRTNKEAVKCTQWEEKHRPHLWNDCTVTNEDGHMEMLGKLHLIALELPDHHYGNEPTSVP